MSVFKLVKKQNIQTH